MIQNKLPIAVAVAAMFTVPISGSAEDDELEFDEARVFLS